MCVFFLKVLFTDMDEKQKLKQTFKKLKNQNSFNQDQTFLSKKKRNQNFHNTSHIQLQQGEVQPLNKNKQLNANKSLEQSKTTGISESQFQQIRKSIESLKSIFPEILDQNVVNQLYNSLFHKITQNQNTPKRNQFQKENSENYHKNTQTFLEEENIIQPRRRQKREKKNLKDIITLQIEEEILDMFKKRKSFSEMKAYFSQKYPKYQQYFGYESLRGETTRIFRIAFKKLKRFSKQRRILDHLPELTQLNQTRYNFLYYYKGGYELRLLLLQIYRMKQFNRSFIAHTIKIINQSFQKYDEEYMLKLQGKKNKSYKGQSQYISQMQEIQKSTEDAEIKIEEQSDEFKQIK